MTLHFKRIMPGEYYSEPEEGIRYSVWSRGVGCPECDHSHEYWLAEVYLGAERLKKGRREIGKYPTFSTAKAAASAHWEAIA